MLKPQQAAELLRVLGSGRRLEILNILLESPESVPSTAIGKVLKIPDGAVSYNLMTLAKVGLVIREPTGPWVFYSPNRRLLREVAAFLLKEPE